MAEARATVLWATVGAVGTVGTVTEEGVMGAGLSRARAMGHHRTTSHAKSLSVRVSQRRPGMASRVTDCRRFRMKQEGTGSLPPIL